MQELKEEIFKAENQLKEQKQIVGKPYADFWTQLAGFLENSIKCKNQKNG